MILILTDKHDSHANFIIPKLKIDNVPFFRFNLDVKSLQNTFVTFSNECWSITQNERSLNSNDVTAVWNRRTFVELLLKEQYDNTTDFKIWKNEWNKTLLGIYYSIHSTKWLNPWRRAYEIENKYLQYDIALKHGLKVPKMIVSNEKKQLIDFALKYDVVALKLMHQDFYKNTDGQYQGFYVNKINSKSLSKFKTRKENPIVLQEYIDKNFEVRYTVVGNEHFVCKIDSQSSLIAKVDWRRYDIPNTPHSIIQPPLEIMKKVTNFMSAVGLEYGAIDFIVDNKEEWVFLEINTMGQYLWIEDLTGLQISNAVINWLKSKTNKQI